MIIKTLKNISQKDISIAGGKGASLGEMTKAKIPVPQGFVVLASTFDRFLKETGLDKKINDFLDKVKIENVNSVEQISDKIRNLINKTEIPKDIEKEIKNAFSNLKTKYVAVRSSATAEDSSTASWAGELESYLNTDKASLLGNIKKCWASLFTPRAISYRFEKKLKNLKVSVAVVVQEMVQSEISGICFTVHPVTKDYNQIIIEAGYGLGEAIVGGIITPDTYIVDKKKLVILDKNISKQEKMIVKKNKKNILKKVLKSEQEKQKLNNTQILELVKICKNIEKHYKKPQDIEWAFFNKRFYIVQSRPITTL